MKPADKLRARMSVSAPGHPHYEAIREAADLLDACEDEFSALASYRGTNYEKYAKRRSALVLARLRGEGDTK